MRETLRCCIACIIPFGALDVIRVVHPNGHVEEITHTVTASDVTRAYPKHVLRKLPSTSFEKAGGGSKTTTVLVPEAELKKGKIYFLVPVVSSGVERKRTVKRAAVVDSDACSETTSLLVPQRWSEEERRRQRGRGGLWRPRLESISEVSNVRCV